MLNIHYQLSNKLKKTIMLNIHYQLLTINYQRSYIQIYTYINLQKSQLCNRIDNN
jgi:hypothetical protein